MLAHLETFPPLISVDSRPSHTLTHTPTNPWPPQSFPVSQEIACTSTWRFFRTTRTLNNFLPLYPVLPIFCHDLPTSIVHSYLLYVSPDMPCFAWTIQCNNFWWFFRIWYILSFWVPPALFCITIFHSHIFLTPMDTHVSNPLPKICHAFPRRSHAMISDEISDNDKMETFEHPPFVYWHQPITQPFPSLLDPSALYPLLQTCHGFTRRSCLMIFDDFSDICGSETLPPHFITPCLECLEVQSGFGFSPLWAVTKDHDRL